MGTAKRERQKQGRQARLVQAQQAAAKRKRTRSGILLAGVVVVLVGITLAIGGLGGDDEDPVDAGAGSTSTSSPFPTITVPEQGATITGATPCPPADGSAERTTTFEQAPPTCIDPAKTYTATIATTMGDIEVSLDQAAAPATVNNFVVLARYHYYDGVAFHRIIPDFMIQTGDAVGPNPGSGGPGYTVPDELPAEGSAYVPGAMAMANSGPETSGSQFFIMASTSSLDALDPSYSLFGQVTAGQEVVDAINLLGDAATNGTPTDEVLVESITITEA
jgi:cyclophilin family peptidyl-prolyl cis-trans isomerase